MANSIQKTTCQPYVTPYRQRSRVTVSILPLLCHQLLAILPGTLRGLISSSLYPYRRVEHLQLDTVLTSIQDASNDPNVGSAQQNADPSASSLITTLVPVLVIAIVWFSVFVLVRNRAAWKYAPRTRSKTLRQNLYSPELPNTALGWLPKLWAIPDSYVLSHQGLDAYLFLRFLKMAVISCLVGAAICIPILMPVDATGGGGQKQLNIISMSNIAKTPLGSWRFFAHAGCAWIFFGKLTFFAVHGTIN